MTIRVEVTDRIRMPKGTIPFGDIKERYVIELFREAKCNPCSNKPDRGPDNELCQACPHFQGVHRFYSSAEYKKGVISLPQADEHGIRRYLEKSGKKFKWIDKRKDYKVEHPFKFTGRMFGKNEVDENGFPRANQKRLVRKWLEVKTGVIRAVARTGKTTIATRIYCKLGVKTVIIANQRDLLNQFHETATGKVAPRFLRGKMVPSSEKAMRRAMTNIEEVAERSNNPVIFMPESYTQLVNYIKKFGYPDVLLVTYQSFTRDFQRVADIINGKYSFGIIDEEHGTGADGYLRFCASLDLKYRLGITATPKRKDGRSQLAERVVGPVVASSSVVAIKPIVEFYAVKAKPKTTYVKWHTAEKWLKENKQRNVEIVQMAFADMRAGHNCIIIPVTGLDHLKLLVKMINKQARINYEKRGETWPEKLAKPFHDGVDRVATLNWVDSIDKHGKVHKKLPTDSPRVLVAVRKMVQQGIDMRRPSMLYSIMPMSAEYGVGAPMAYQMFFRVCTPFNKPAPTVRVFVDNIKMMAVCAKTLLYNEILPKAKRNAKEQLYILRDYEAAKTLLNNRTVDRRASSARWW